MLTESIAETTFNRYKHIGRADIQFRVIGLILGIFVFSRKVFKYVSHFSYFYIFNQTHKLAGELGLANLAPARTAVRLCSRVHARFGLLPLRSAPKMSMLFNFDGCTKWSA